MKGAIIGDIVGSVYEGKTVKSKDFELFKNNCRITDDTVMTAAAADALMRCRRAGIAEESSMLAVLVECMQQYGRRHIDAGYSRRFRAWLTSDSPQPYGASTNGALMRCSSAGWLAESVEEARRLGRVTALPSHDHPEALAAAAMCAELIFRARTGASKEELLRVIQTEYEIPSVEAIRPSYQFDMSCRGTLPVCFAAFYEGKDFEDVLRTAVSLGGDADTNGAVACSLAEAFWGVPETLWVQAQEYCSEDILAVVSRWEQYLSASRA